MIKAPHTIVLIHGFGFDSRIWAPVELAFDDFSIIYLSLPGFGMTDLVSAYTIEGLAGQFWEKLESLSVGAVHLVGHSMGGYVCIEMAAQKMDRVLSLGLIHSHVFEDGPEKKAQRTETMKQVQLNGREELVHHLIPSLFANRSVPDALIRGLVKRGMHYPDDAWIYGTRAMRDRKDHSDTLRLMHAPVLLIGGENDGAVPVDLTYKMAGMAERCFLRIYPATGHMSMYENGPVLIGDLQAFYAHILSDRML